MIDSLEPRRLLAAFPLTEFGDAVVQEERVLGVAYGSLHLIDATGSTATRSRIDLNRDGVTPSIEASSIAALKGSVYVAAESRVEGELAKVVQIEAGRVTRSLDIPGNPSDEIPELVLSDDYLSIQTLAGIYAVDRALKRYQYWEYPDGFRPVSAIVAFGNTLILPGNQDQTPAQYRLELGDGTIKRVEREAAYRVPVPVDGSVYYVGSAGNPGMLRIQTGARVQRVAGIETSSEDVVSYAGRVWIGAKDGLWSSDGTAKGTRHEWTPPGDTPQVTALSSVGGKLYFATGGTQPRVWVTSTSPANATKIKGFNKLGASYFNFGRPYGNSAVVRAGYYASFETFVTGGTSATKVAPISGDYAGAYRGGAVFSNGLESYVWTDVNSRPTIKLSGTTTISEGQGLSLTATAFDADADELGFQWDIDGDGKFEGQGSFRNDTRSTMDLTWEQLHRDAPTQFVVSVRVRDAGSVSPTIRRLVVINDTPPTTKLTVPATGTTGIPTSVKFTYGDVAGEFDPFSSAKINWGDGEIDVVRQLSASHIYDRPGTYTLSVAVRNKDAITKVSRKITIEQSTARPAGLHRISLPSSSADDSFESSTLQPMSERITQYDGRLIYLGPAVDQGSGLFVGDGNGATAQIKLPPRADGMYEWPRITRLHRTSNALYAISDTDGAIFQTDGTDEGTTRLTDIDYSVGPPVEWNGRTYFAVGRGLQSTDGVSRELIGERFPSDGQPRPEYGIERMVVFNGRLFLIAVNEQDNNVALFQFRAGRIRLVMSLNHEHFVSLSVNDEKMFIVVESSVNATQGIFISDGTSAGTLQFQKTGTPLEQQYAVDPVAIRSGIVFFANLHSNPYDPVIKMVAHISNNGVFTKVGLPDGQPSLLAVTPTKVFITGKLGTTDRQIAVTDGTTGGTRILTSRKGGYGVEKTLVVEGAAYFTAKRMKDSRPTLLRSDGTSTGTFELLTANPEERIGAAFVREVGGHRRVSFLKADTSGVRHVYVTDGTIAGTVETGATMQTTEKLNTFIDSVPVLGGALLAFDPKPSRVYRLLTWYEWLD